MTLSPLRIALYAYLVCASAGVAAQEAQQLNAVRLSVGMHAIRAEVARTPQERSTGLMFRTALGTSDGMLFEFEERGEQCFWMKNTPIPLSIAFITDDGRIVNIDRMRPRSLDSHCSAEPVRFALEMNEGWFEKRGIKPGAQVKGAPFAN